MKDENQTQVKSRGISFADTALALKAHGLPVDNATLDQWDALTPEFRAALVESAKANRALSTLVAAADSINAFAEKFTIRANPIRYALGTKAVLADVFACVTDDDGGPLEAGSTPVGKVRLDVIIEHFRENGRTYTAAGRVELAAAEKAENDIIAFCKSLGFKVVFESNTGSGEYGQINLLSLFVDLSAIATAKGGVQ